MAIDVSACAVELSETAPTNAVVVRIRDCSVPSIIASRPIPLFHARIFVQGVRMLTDGMQHFPRIPDFLL